MCCRSLCAAGHLIFLSLFRIVESVPYQRGCLAGFNRTPKAEACSRVVKARNYLRAHCYKRDHSHQQLARVLPILPQTLYIATSYLLVLYAISLSYSRQLSLSTIATSYLLVLYGISLSYSRQLSLSTIATSYLLAI